MTQGCSTNFFLFSQKCSNDLLFMVVGALKESVQLKRAADWSWVCEAVSLVCVRYTFEEFGWVHGRDAPIWSAPIHIGRYSHYRFWRNICEKNDQTFQSPHIATETMRPAKAGRVRGPRGDPHALLMGLGVRRRDLLLCVWVWRFLCISAGETAAALHR